MTTPTDYDLYVGIAFGTDPTTAQDPTRGTLTWTEVTSDVIACSIKRGRDKITDEMPPGVCTFTLQNQSGDYDPVYSAGTYYSSVPWTGAHVVVAADNSSTTEKRLFYGYIRANEGVQVTFDDFVSYTTISAYDWLGVAAESQYQGLTPSDQSPGTAVDEAMDDAGFSNVARSLDTGNATLQSGELAWTGDLLGFLQQIARSEGGVLWCDVDGTVTFDGRSAYTESRFTSSQRTFSDDGADTEILRGQIAGVW